ncbi:MAG: AAA family ATPase [Planctomycetes bacterium]|nr:AAA family ATPase [Planctomycetota bacterium]
MIVERITLRSWRTYREPHTFVFDERFTLLVGRNESGKSTIFEALARVLFDRHGSTAKEIRDMQPLGSSLGPEAELVLCAGGARYRVVKRFLYKSKCELFFDRQGRWELDHEGDAADDRLRALFGSEEFRGATRAEHRGLAQALWYLQGEPAIPQAGWHESVERGLGGLVSQVARFPREDPVLARIEKEYADFWTPQGREKEAGAAAALRSEIAHDAERVGELRTRWDTLVGARTGLEEARHREREFEAELLRCDGEIATLLQELDALEAESRAIAEAKQQLSLAQEKRTRLESDLSAVARRDGEARERGSDARTARGECETAESLLRAARADARRHRKSWEDELEPQAVAAGGSIRALEALQRLAGFGEERMGLERRKKSLGKLLQELARVRGELRGLRAPSRSDWKDFEGIRAALLEAEAQLSASGIYVAFDLPGRQAVTSDPPAPPGPDGEHLVTRPTTFRVAGVGEIRVRGGGATLEELDRRVKERRLQVSETLRFYGTPDPDALRELHERRTRMEGDEARLDKERDNNEDTLEDLDGRLTALEDRVRKTRETVEAHEKARAEWATLSAERIESLLAEHQDSRGRLERRVKEERELEAQAQKQASAYSEAAEKSRKAQAEAESGADRLRQENAETLKSYGTLDNLKRLERAARQDETTLTDELARREKDYQARSEGPRKLLEGRRAARKDLERKRDDERTRMTKLETVLDQAAAEGLYSKTGDLEAALEVRRRRLATLERRAAAVKALRNLVEAHRQSRSAALAGPLAERVNPWLAFLTEGTSDGLTLTDGLLPSDVHVPRYDSDLPERSLSYGAREQIVVLLRLGIATLLSESERQAVIIDDRLVNADPLRAQRLAVILREAQARVQVIVATCNETPYAGIPGKVIRVPEDGLRESSAG